VINATGTSLRFKPGFVIGGRHEHDCGAERSVGYFIEGVLPLCLFAKKRTDLVLKGCTSGNLDIGVDTLLSTTLPLLQHFGIEPEMLSLKVDQRGMPPAGGGRVTFRCAVVRSLKPVQLLDLGKVKRVRGVAYACRVSPQFANRVISSAKGELLKLLPDVYINSDHRRGRESGASPGFGLSLVATSTGEGASCNLSAEHAAAAAPRHSDVSTGEGEAGRGAAGAELASQPEALGILVAHQLLEEIARGGFVDTSHQPLVLLLMVLCPEDVSKLRVGKLSPQAIGALRLAKAVFGTTFRVQEEPETETVVLSCLGTGAKNLNRKVT